MDAILIYAVNFFIARSVSCHEGRSGPVFDGKCCPTSEHYTHITSHHIMMHRDEAVKITDTWEDPAASFSGSEGQKR
jgi:hypothetical protein